MRTLLAVLCAAIALPLFAQTRYLPDAVGVWKPWQFVAYPDDQRQLAATPADLKALQTHLIALNSILKATPGFAAPVGFSVETVGGLEPLGFSLSTAAGQPVVARRPLPASLNFGAFGIHEWVRDGKTVREDTGETTQLLFFVNHLARPFSGAADAVPEFESLDTDVTRLAAAQPDVFGMSRYADTLVLKRSPAPIWQPVRLEEAQSLALRGIERRVADRRDVAARLQAQYDEMMDPKQRDRRIAEYKAIATLSKEPAYLDTMLRADAAIQKNAETLLGPIAAARAEVAAVEQELARAVASAAAASAADREAPACYAEREPVSFSRFRRHDGEACVPLVRPNWSIFNPALPRSAPQLLVITHFEGCLVEGQRVLHPGGCVANRRLLEALDTRAVRAWLQ